jgi:hypothetical protein
MVPLLRPGERLSETRIDYRFSVVPLVELSSTPYLHRSIPC